MGFKNNLQYARVRDQKHHMFAETPLSEKTGEYSTILHHAKETMTTRKHDETFTLERKDGFSFQINSKKGEIDPTMPFVKHLVNVLLHEGKEIKLTTVSLLGAKNE
ncbi:MAG TPA: hypothetical protein EYN38_00245 [Flavobacteriales bacterium]|nr:hypothetical protein [Flavobacteriales bacterium]